MTSRLIPRRALSRVSRPTPTAGSYLYEPGGSVHTLEIPAENVADTVVHIRVVGANITFAEDGFFHSLVDATALVFLTELFGGQLELRCIRESDARYTVAGADGPAELSPRSPTSSKPLTAWVSPSFPRRRI